MARPIPFNEHGPGDGHIFEADAFVPAWDGRVQAAPRQDARHWPGPGRDVRPVAGAVPVQVRRAGGRSATGLVFLLVSGLVGSLAIVSALGVWPALAAADLGLEDQEVFYLLAGGIYLLATAFYAGWRTRLMRGFHEAPWDARLMALANMAVGGALALALGVVTMAMVAVVLLLAGLCILLFSGTSRRPAG